ncbi:MAG: hypothetical protein HN691_01480 [Bacteroidetes bacterium]|jgi:hypothetical protein|nr:hypothetical protein [Bacteroidota bacterium]
MNYSKKALPNPAKPIELFGFYLFHLKKILTTSIRLRIQDPFGYKQNKVYDELLKQRDTKKNIPCFVLANGPSLNKLDPKKIRTFCSEHDAEVFCVNYFPNSEFARIAGYDHWVISDPYFFKVDQDVPLPKREILSSTFGNVKKHLRQCVYAPSKEVAKVKNKMNVPVIGFNDIEISTIFSDSINPVKPRSYISMSAYKALAIACYLGFSPIYICGFDNSYITNLGCDRENRIFRKNEHFDENAYKSSSPIQLLSYKYRSVADELISNSRLFSDLEKFNEHLILNLDVDSLTDAFRKDDSLDIYVQG